MKMTVTLSRSDQWLTAKRLATGDNIPDYVVTEVEIAELSEETRKLFLEIGCGNFMTDLTGLAFDPEFMPKRLGGYSSYGRIPFYCDVEAPTVADVDFAIKVAMEKLAEKREKFLVEEKERKEKEAVEKVAKAERERKIAEARELLKPELERLAKVERDRETLSAFLTFVPQDALRGALKEMAQADKEDTIAFQIEAASTEVVFEDEE